MFALIFLAPALALTSSDHPLDELAKQIAAIAGPGPAKVTIKNRSGLAPEQLPAIRQKLERDLQSYGVTPLQQRRSCDRDPGDTFAELTT